MATACSRRGFALVRGFCRVPSTKQTTRCLHSNEGITNAEARQKRNALFEEEKKRQRSLIPFTEKIEVQYVGQPKDHTLIMNKNMSTPYSCAMHIQEVVKTRSVLALVDDEPWDMHRPLTDSCRLRLLHMEDDDPTLPNQAFWRSCSFILGYVLETAFKPHNYIQLCSFPSPDLKSLSFVYDVHLGFDWNPVEWQLRSLSRTGYRLFFHDLPFERLDVDASLAERMFEDNTFKLAQIPLIASKSESGSTVTVYRMGDHVDITRGPLMANTNQLGRFSVAAMHRIESLTYGPLTRFQGTALPIQLFSKVHYWTFEKVLIKRAVKFNKSAPIPELSPAKPLQRTVNE